MSDFIAVSGIPHLDFPPLKIPQLVTFFKLKPKLNMLKIKRSFF